MTTFSRRLAVAFSLLAMTACCPTTTKFLGNPMEPYPLAAEPKLGDFLHLPTGLKVTQRQMLDVAADARVVYVGETHDNPASHRLELETLRGLEERHPGQVALGMEMFNRSQQPALDRWVAGELDEKAFLRESRWFDNWKMDFRYYRDLLNYAREHHIPVIGLNAESSLVQAVRSKPLADLSPEQKAQLPEMDETDPYQRGLAEAIFAGHTHGKMVVEGFLRAQTLWDEYMAESAARYLASPQGKSRHLLVVAGGNHVTYGFGIPRRVFRRIPISYVLIGGREIEVAEGKEPEIMDVDIPEFPMVPYHFLAFFSYEELPKQGVQLGVMFDQVEGQGVVAKSVLPGSNAERAGVREGDRLRTLDGEPLKDGYDLVYALKQKKVGDKSVLEVEREGKTLKLEVVYQAAEPHGHPKK